MLKTNSNKVWIMADDDLFMQVPCQSHTSSLQQVTDFGEGSAYVEVRNIYFKVL